MDQAERRGCLSVILRSLGINLGSGAKSAAVLPYRQRDDFLSAAELSFYRVLLASIPDRATVCPKVNLADIVFVASPNENQGAKNKIDRKHIDFLICDSKTMRPLCAFELDDSSHSRSDRQERDRFVDEVFRAVGLPLLRIPAKAAYNSASVLSLLEPFLKDDKVGDQQKRIKVEVSSQPPNCPKCGVPLVRRVAKQGPNSGQEFYGCPNYPRCKEIVRI